jgi:hypothetical protein
VADGQAWAVMVFRGVDTTTPFAPSSVSATGTATGRFNAAAITPSNSGSWIVIAGGGAAAAGAAYVAPTGFTTDWLAPAAGADTNDAMAAMGYYTGWTSGSYDPAVVTGGTTGANDSWAAWTMALKPDPAQTISQSSRFDNAADLDNAHQVNLVLPQGTSFSSDTNSFYAATVSGSTPQTLTQSAIFNNTSTFYAPQVNLGLVQNGPYNWFGSSEWSPILSPDPDTFYAATLTQGDASQNLTASLFTNTNSFYSASISTLVTLSQGTTFSDGDTFHSPTVSFVLTQGTRFDNSPSFYAPSLRLGLIQGTRFDNSPTFHAPSLSLGLTQATRAENTSIHYAPSLRLGLTQGTRFDNSPNFYAATVSQAGATQNLTASLYTNSPSFYGPSLSLGLTQASRLDNSQSFYVPQVNLVLLGNLATNTSQFFSATVVADGATQSLTQTTRAENTQTFYGSDLFLDQLLVPLRSENANAFYGPALRNQYPDPSFVLSGTQYGEPGLEFTGTYVQTLDKSIKVDVVGGKLVKLINNKVALTF